MTLAGRSPRLTGPSPTTLSEPPRRIGRRAFAVTSDRADQAVPRRPDRRQPHRSRRPGRLGVRLPRAQRLRQDHHHPDAAGPGPADRGQPHPARRPDPGGLATGAAAGRGAGRGSGLPPVPQSGRDNLRRLDAADRTADPATCAAADRDGAGSGRSDRRRGQAVPQLLAWGCGNGWASPPRCCSHANC